MNPEGQAWTTHLAWVATGAASIGAATTYWNIIKAGPGVLQAVELAAFAAVTVLLLYGNLVYQLARAGAVTRQATHARADRGRLEEVYSSKPSAVAVLIPSYKEEQGVLWQTLMSAALAEYPGRRVIALVDDPPNKTSACRSWAAIRDVQSFFASARAPFDEEAEAAKARLSGLAAVDCEAEGYRLAILYERAADVLEALAAPVVPRTHTETFFRDAILLRPASSHRERAHELRSSPLTAEQVRREYNRLASLFGVHVDGFERKRWANLFHEPNKAMNLNSYIGLIGKHLRANGSGRSTTLMECSAEDASLRVPEYDFVLTLDADSLILADYILTLVETMRRDPTLAVVQTPYSSVPNAPSAVERAAGATTDIQYLVHQGFTRFGATYWVGANALLRVAALRQIATKRNEGGHEVPVFIQDRTVIEDTGSTIDLIAAGWTLHNYPERLAYSATPPDFRSLAIQRHRWANGGLIILPDLLRAWRQHHDRWHRVPELMLRLHYLVSPAVASLSVLLLLLYPFDLALGGIWLPLMAIPYFFLYGLDLVRVGYGPRDLLRVYALNLLLVPVNVAGVIQCMHQVVTGKKSPFRRTPKIEDRTPTSALFILADVAIIAFLAFSALADLILGNASQALLCGVNAGILAYGFTTFIGWRLAWNDLWSADRVARLTSVVRSRFGHNVTEAVARLDR